MKPCFTKRKLVVCLALGQLDTQREPEVRAHLGSCDGCRRYHAELLALEDRLAAAAPAEGVEASAAFHRRLVRRLQADSPQRPFPGMATWLSALRLNLRVALPALGLAAAVIIVLTVLSRQEVVPPASQPRHPAVPRPVFAADMLPTIANYQQVAARSLDEFDDLLTRQARCNPPSGRMYTAAALAPVSD